MEDNNHQPVHNGSLIQSLNKDDKRQLTKEDSVWKRIVDFSNLNPLSLKTKAG